MLDLLTPDWSWTKMPGTHAPAPVSRERWAVVGWLRRAFARSRMFRYRPPTT